jgi:hypothetical protein
VFAFAATTAFSQANFTLRADVPFSFSIDGRHCAAGSYELRTINSSTVRLLNIETGDVRLVRLISPEQAGSGWNRAAPVLRFVRNGEHAYLISLTDGDGNGWNVPVASKDLEASRGAQSKNIAVALK